MLYPYPLYHIPLNLLKTPFITLNFLRFYHKLKPYFINAGNFFVTKGFVNYWHKKGLKIFVWHGINTKKSMTKLINKGVDALINDRPDLMATLKTSGYTPSL